MSKGDFKNRVFRFMYGRYAMYGADTLSKVIFYSYLILLPIFVVVAILVKSIWLSLAFTLVEVALVTWVFARMFSKNIAARKRENEKFCGFFKLRRNKFKDRKTHVYRKCPKCKVVLRLPKAKGKHFVVCPKCKERFRVKG